MITGSTPTTGNITANAQSITIAAAQLDRVAIQVTGTWVATLTFEISFDGGTTYVGCSPVATTSTARTTGVATTAANGVWEVDAVAATHVRVRSTAYTSGTAVVLLVPAVIGR